MAHPLYVSDLDGTLLQPDGKLSDFGLAALADLTARGIPFTVASGRPFSSIRRALGPTRLNLPVISSDGALISMFDSPEPLHLFAMDEGHLDRLLEDLAGLGFSPILDVWDGVSNYLLSDRPQNPVMEWFHDHKSSEEFYLWRESKTLERSTGAQTISITLADRPEWLEPLKADLEERYGEWFKIDYAVWEGIDDAAALWIESRDARKEKALEVLAKMLGYEACDVVVFGDELNDLGMFQGDWHAVAVGNARTEVKELAREVIGHHAEDSVLKYIVRSCS